MLANCVSNGTSGPNMVSSRLLTFSGLDSSAGSSLGPSCQSIRQIESGCWCISEMLLMSNVGSNQNMRWGGKLNTIFTSQITKFSTYLSPSNGTPSSRRTAERTPSQAITQSAVRA